MQAFIDKLADDMFGKTPESCCVNCKTLVNPDEDFRDAISLKEWNISHM